MFLFLLFLHFHSFSSFSPVPLSISSVSLFPFPGRRHKMTYRSWRVVKPQYNQSIKSESLLSAWRNFAFLAIQNAHSEDSDQTAWIAGWSESSLRTMCTMVHFLTVRRLYGIIRFIALYNWVKLRGVFMFTIFMGTFVLKKYIEPSLQWQHLFPKTLPLKWICCR